MITFDGNRIVGRWFANPYIWLLVCSVLCVVSIVVYVMKNDIERSEQLVIESIEKRQSDILEQHAEYVASMMIDYVNEGKSLAKSKIFRQLLADISKSAEVPVKSLKSLQDFVGVSAFSDAYIYTAKGRLVVSTEKISKNDEKRFKQYITRAFESRLPIFSTLQQGLDSLSVELFLPVYPVNAMSESVEPIRVLVLKIPMTQESLSFLGDVQVFQYNSMLSAIQSDGVEYQSAVLDSQNKLILQKALVVLGDANQLKFSLRLNLNRKQRVYSSAIKIPVINWWIVLETSSAEVQTGFVEYRAKIIAIVALSVAVILLLVGVIYLMRLAWKKSSVNESLKYRLAVVSERCDLLGEISNCLIDPISLTDWETGKYIYANKAFADVFDKRLNAIANFGDYEVFQKTEAERLQHANEMCIASGDYYTQEISLRNGHSDRHMQVVKSICLGGDGQKQIVSVFRDMSSKMQIDKRNVETLRQIIDALVRAIESTPFLEGHTTLMRLLAIEVADTLLLSDAEITTVEAAAILSQVGKSFVSENIFQKQGDLSEDEMMEMRRYVEHTCSLIEGIDFNLPITKTIYQMQELIDGSGYPHGLKGDEISNLAGILGVTNAFSAMVKNRSYRPAKTALQAVDTLEQMAGKKFDRLIVNALRNVVESYNGQSILAASDVLL